MGGRVSPTDGQEVFEEQTLLSAPEFEAGNIQLYRRSRG
jgi:hypothetical protein